MHRLFFLWQNADKHPWAVRLPAQIGGFETDQGCYFSPSTILKIVWKWIHMRTEYGDSRRKTSLHFLFLFCCHWCSEESGVAGLSLIARTIQDGEPIHQAIHFSLTLRETRNIIKSHLDNHMNTIPGVQPCSPLCSPWLVSEAIRHTWYLFHVSQKYHGVPLQVSPHSPQTNVYLTLSSFISSDEYTPFW